MAQVQPPSARMSPASRYHSNLKVLRRRDPSITSIFDQFSHVCIYHHNGKKWEKHGFEGSMFLYERQSYPPYGFYILNRVGMDDYIQRLYPEDDITAHGGYLMLRSYPNFTATRLDTIQQSLPFPVPDKFSNLYAYTDDRNSAQKGESQTIGLWTFSTDGRESLHDVVLRLHSFIKKNLPYPDDYRYGPDRPPPPNPYLRTAATSTPSGDDSDSQGTQPSAPGLSELDKLFAKFLPQQQPNPLIASSAASAPMSTSSVSLQSLLNALGGPDVPPTQAQAPLQQYQPGAFPTPPPRTQSTGITLLDTIFASASTPTHVGPLSQPPPMPTGSTSTPSYLHPSTIQQHTIPIHSPTPESKALPPPQVLSQNVIGSLLGLTPSRTPSAASSTASYSTPSFGPGGIGGGGGGSGGDLSSSPSHPSSRDGDNEDESHTGSSSDGSGGSGGLGTIAAHALGRSVPIQIRAPLQQLPQQQQTQLQASDPAFKTLGLGLGVGVNGQPTSIHGDATPRPTFVTNENMQKIASAASSSSVKTPAATTNKASSASANGETKPPRNGRPLVPFEPNSDLWPYPRQPQAEPQQGTSGVEGGGGGEDEGEIVELDWEDMSALSDPAAFLRAQRQQHQLRTGGGGGKKPNGIRAGVAVGTETGTGTGVVEETTKGRKKKDKKKNKKERLEAVAREREAIEQSWDFPTTQQQPQHNSNFDFKNGGGGVVNGVGMMMNLNGKNVPIPVTFHSDSPPATPSPVRSPLPEAHPELLPGHQQEREEDVSVSGSTGSVNGNGSAKKKNRRKGKKSGAGGAVGEIGGPVQPDRVQESLVACLSEQPEVRRPTVHERNVFVRQVLTLIQTDPEFADTLWRKYYAHSA